MKKPTIGQAELQVLQYIQDHHPITVRDVAAHFARTRGHVRTTTLNVMGRLLEKGYLARRKTGGIYHYTPGVPKRDMLRTMVGDFVQRALGGSLSPFVAYLAEHAEVNEKELAELKRLVGQLETRQNKGKP